MFLVELVDCMEIFKNYIYIYMQIYEYAQTHKPRHIQSMSTEEYYLDRPDKGFFFFFI